MAIIGNILLAIATIVFIALTTILLGKEPKGGDNLMGYGWGIILLNLLFSACMILVTMIIASKGGFEWVAAKKSSRFWFVTIGLISALLTAAVAGLFKYEPGPIPLLIRLYSSFAPILIPFLLLTACFVLLNHNLRDSVPVAAFKWPLVLVSIIGVTGMASALMGFISDSVRNQTAVTESIRNQNNDNHDRMMQEIDSIDVMKDFVFLLVFTGDNQDPAIREKSVARVKTHPQWQQELIRLLQTDWAPEPFQFLASNEVDDPSIFLEPVREGVLIQARLIRESIRNSSHPSHLYEGQFSWEIERVIRTVDKFKGKGVDYTPAMKELRAALDEPSSFEKPKFKCISILDEWIKANP